MAVNIVTKSDNELSKDVPVENLNLAKPSIIQLEIAPEKVAKFERNGDDLTLLLKDGRTVTVQHFFVLDANGVRNDLVLLDDAGVLSLDEMVEEAGLGGQRIASIGKRPDENPGLQVGGHACGQ